MVNELIIIDKSFVSLAQKVAANIVSDFNITIIFLVWRAGVLRV